MRALPALFVPALLWALSSSPAAAGKEGVLEGRVVNGSEGGGPVAGLEVTLSSDPATAGQFAAITNSLGEFRFEGLSTSGDVYAVAVRYQGVDYRLSGIRVDAAIPSPLVDLHVYETTTNAEAVTALLDHQIVRARPDERFLEVVNYVEVANSGDRTVVDGEAGAVQGKTPLLPLPEGAENVQFLGEVSKAGALLDAHLSNLGQAIPPGEHRLLFAYELPYADGSFVFRKPLDFDTERAVFLMSAREGEAESRQMPTLEEVDTAAGAQQILTGEELPAGTVVEVTLTGLPVDGGPSLQSILAPAAVISAILVLGAMVAYARSWRRHAPGWPSGDSHG